MTIDGEFDLNRGDMIVRLKNKPKNTQVLELMIFWLDKTNLDLKKKYILKHTTNEVKAIFSDIIYKINIKTLHRDTDNLNIKMNDIARVRIRTSKPLFVDPYKDNRHTGSVIFIDEFSNQTVAGGLILIEKGNYNEV